MMGTKASKWLKYSKHACKNDVKHEELGIIELLEQVTKDLDNAIQICEDKQKYEKELKDNGWF